MSVGAPSGELPGIQSRGQEDRTQRWKNLQFAPRSEAGPGGGRGARNPDLTSRGGVGASHTPGSQAPES